MAFSPFTVWYTYRLYLVPKETRSPSHAQPHPLPPALGSTDLLWVHHFCIFPHMSAIISCAAFCVWGTASPLLWDTHRTPEGSSGTPAWVYFWLGRQYPGLTVSTLRIFCLFPYFVVYFILPFTSSCLCPKLSEYTVLCLDWASPRQPLPHWPWDVCVLSRSVVSNSLWSHGPWPASSAVHEDSPGKKTGVGCHFLLQENFPIQGSNPGPSHCRQILYWLSHQGSPYLGMVLGKTHEMMPPFSPSQGIQWCFATYQAITDLYLLSKEPAFGNNRNNLKFALQNKFIELQERI